MTVIEKLSWEYPTLDTVKMRLLLMISKHPGWSVRELGDAVNLSEKSAQHYIKMLTATGRPGRKGRALGLVTCSTNPYDKRCYQVNLTPYGEDLVKLIQPLNQEGK